MNEQQQAKIKELLKSMAQDLGSRLRKKKYKVFNHPTMSSIFVFMHGDPEPLRIDFLQRTEDRSLCMYLKHRLNDIRDDHEMWLSLVDVIESKQIYYRFERYYGDVASYFLLPRKSISTTKKKGK